MIESPFTAAWNWCDGRCDRCRLTETCPNYLRQRQRRWAHEQRGIDPDDPDVVMEDVGRALETAVKMLHQMAEEEGIDFDDVEDDAPASLFRRRLEDTCVAYACAAYDLFDRGPDDDDDDPEDIVDDFDDTDDLEDDASAAVHGVLSAATSISAKLASLGAHLTPEGDPDDEDEWQAIAVPILLAAECLEEEIRAGLEHLGVDSAPLHAARADLWRCVGPWFDAIPITARSVLEDLVRQGLAPSPFSLDAAD